MPPINISDNLRARARALPKTTAQPGAPGRRGPEGPAGSPTWVSYAAEFTVAPTAHPTPPVAGGDVYTYVKGATTLYRHVPDPYDATFDTFYENYSAGVLSNPRISRS